MKFELIENDHGVTIHITPENVKDTGVLLRASKNAKKEAVSIHYSFPMNSEPSCNIFIGKIIPTKQYNSVSNKNQ